MTTTPERLTPERLSLLRSMLDSEEDAALDAADSRLLLSELDAVRKEKEWMAAQIEIKEKALQCVRMCRQWFEGDTDAALAEAEEKARAGMSQINPDAWRNHVRDEALEVAAKCADALAVADKGYREYFDDAKSAAQEIASQIRSLKSTPQSAKNT